MYAKFNLIYQFYFADDIHVSSIIRGWKVRWPGNEGYEMALPKI